MSIESMPKQPGYDTSKVVSPAAKEAFEKVEGGKAAVEFMAERSEKIDNAKMRVINLTQFHNSKTFKTYESLTSGKTDAQSVFTEANKVLDEIEATQKDFQFLQTEKQEVSLVKKPITAEDFNKFIVRALGLLISDIDLKEQRYNLQGQDLVKQRIKNLMPKEKNSI